MYAGHYNCALPLIEVGSNNNTTISTEVANQTKIIGGEGNSFIFKFNASDFFSPWLIYISYESRERLDFTGFLGFFSFLLVLLLGKWKKCVIAFVSCDNDNF